MTVQTIAHTVTDVVLGLASHRLPFHRLQVCMWGEPGNEAILGQFGLYSDHT